MKGPAIHVENLNLILGASAILRGINFEVPAGGIHCLIGPNGGGKTSTLRCLLGQMPHRGTIRIDWPDNDRTIGYVPQLLELERTLPLTVTDFLALVMQDKPAFAGREPAVAGRIAEVLEKVGLAGKETFMLGSLSGGERQRLLFAQALTPAPALLILDEPMTSMDETGLHIFERLIVEMNQQGTTILWVNHDLKQVKRLAHTVTAIDGTVLAHGPVGSALSDDMEMGAFHPWRET